FSHLVGAAAPEESDFVCGGNGLWGNRGAASTAHDPSRNGPQSRMEFRRLLAGSGEGFRRLHVVRRSRLHQLSSAKTFAASTGRERTTCPLALRGANVWNLYPGQHNNVPCTQFRDPDYIFSFVLARVRSHSAAAGWRCGKNCSPLVTILFHVSKTRPRHYRFRADAGVRSLRFLPRLGSFIWRYGPRL